MGRGHVPLTAPDSPGLASAIAEPAPELEYGLPDCYGGRELDDGHGGNFYCDGLGPPDLAVRGSFLFPGRRAARPDMSAPAVFSIAGARVGAKVPRYPPGHPQPPLHRVWEVEKNAIRVINWPSAGYGPGPVSCPLEADRWNAA